ncbi:MAG: hypothetical protein A3H50_01825 [Candidatus Levybacteria bacterium RIFCSPLOWO2_02_FULL_37_10]|nr:MAG: hypothetical protein A2860_02845 [Candidatus Levybacteria bacterium RIFCSPHIGHO2_01_FULL_37_33]OGH17194.1 MAG: hypothetical protein A3C97_00465 [Candidatus Levybacteria bacterium RIFCSPHIGHO2_02_FULL_37_11]OGH29551.1 MAG: hypothetical protein A3F30_02545 [Candidatus Levybacteria bacterium RIFCSPHIGHO2_12_FULL_37_12]OGH43144.1 MAG: hypothetical protein A3H50_01825 [Candidatus Levybacteria bacterium RIFCSPLOWO2_02_FULL_37_10]
MKISAFVRRSSREVGPKIFLFFLFSILYSLFSIQSVSAQSINPAPQNSYTAPNTNPDVPKNLHTYTQSVMLEVASGLSCLIAGVDPVNPNGKCLGPDPKTGKIGYVDNGGGAIGFMGNMITMLYTPPLHTIDYIQNLAQNFGITKPAFARLADYEDTPGTPADTGPTVDFGTGFYAISPLMNIWTAFRNIAYMLFVLVFVIIGVAIMLRIRIDPRTVMTIQNQIPKLIIGILLVTFSFAIAGFLIDVMWIAIYLFYGMFNSIPGVDVTSLSPQNIAGTTPMGAVGLSGGLDIAKNGAEAISGMITGFFNNAFGGLFGKIFGGLLGSVSPAGGVGTLVGAGIGTVIAPGVGTLVGAGIGNVAGGIIGNIIGVGGGGISLLGGGIAFLIIAIVLLWALFRVWFALLGAYIAILINIVFAPFWIIGGLVPGSKISFSGWLRSMLGNLAAFPATLVMFMLGKVFMDTITFASVSSGQAFVPPFIGNLAETKQFGALIGLGIILTIPNVVKMMKTAFNAPQMDLSSIGAAVGAGTAVPIGTGRNIGQTILSSREYVPDPSVAGGWRQRGRGLAFLGKIVGGR